jgi:hypothetical protein
MTPVVKAASPGAVYLVDVATGTATTLTTGYKFSSTDWSPGGAHILVGSNNYTDGGPYGFIVSVLRNQSRDRFCFFQAVLVARRGTA